MGFNNPPRTLSPPAPACPTGVRIGYSAIAALGRHQPLRRLIIWVSWVYWKTTGERARLDPACRRGQQESDYSSSRARVPCTS